MTRGARHLAWARSEQTSQVRFDLEAFGLSGSRVRGADLKNQGFPLEVRFSGGWKQIHFVNTETFRGSQIVRLWDRDNREVAKVYPDTELRIRAGQNEDSCIIPQ